MRLRLAPQDVPGRATDTLYQPIEDLLASNLRENAHLALSMLNAHLLQRQAAHDFDGAKVMGFLHHIERKALRDGGSYMVPLWNDFLFNVAYWGILSHPGVFKSLHNLTIDNLVTDKKMAGALLRGHSFEGVLTNKTASPHWATVYRWSGMWPSDQPQQDVRQIFESMAKEESVDEILAFSTLTSATTSFHLLVWHADEWFNSLRLDEGTSENLVPILEKIIAIATLARQESLRNCGCNNDLPWFDTWVGRDCDVLQVFSQKDDAWDTFMKLLCIVSELAHAGHISGSAADGTPTLHRLLTGDSTSFLRHRTPLLRLLCTDFKYTASAFRHTLRLDVLSWSSPEGHSWRHGTIWFINEWLRSPSLVDWIAVDETRHRIISRMVSMVGTAVSGLMKNCGYDGDFPWISTFVADNYKVARLLHMYKSYGWPRLWDKILEAEQKGLLTGHAAWEIPLLWRLAHAKNNRWEDEAFNEHIYTTRAELVFEKAQFTPLPPSPRCTTDVSWGRSVEEHGGDSKEVEGWEQGVELNEVERESR